MAVIERPKRLDVDETECNISEFLHRVADVIDMNQIIGGTIVLVDAIGYHSYQFNMDIKDLHGAIGVLQKFAEAKAKGKH